MHKTLTMTATALLALFILVPAQPASGAWGWVDLTQTLTVQGITVDYLAIAVEPNSGKLFLDNWTTGIWTSTNQGATISRVDGGKIYNGGPFTPRSFLADPAGNRLVAFNMWNTAGPSGYSLDGGATWTSMTSVGRNWDWGAVDWTSGAVIAARHEDSGVYYSSNMGQTWSLLPSLDRGNVYGVGTFGSDALLWSGYGANGWAIYRSTNQGATWTNVASYTGQGPLTVYNGVGYWIASTGYPPGNMLLVSQDRGLTWQLRGSVGAPVCSGPFFGSSVSEMVVATLTDIRKSADGGQTWQVVTTYPAGVPVAAWSSYGCGLHGLAYDRFQNVYYMYFTKNGVQNSGAGQVWKCVWDDTPPAQITNLASGTPEAIRLTLTWTATGDDGSTGTASSYDLRYSTTPITNDATFAAATQITGVPAPKGANSVESFTVTGLQQNTTYYFAIKAIDKGGNASPLSNVVVVTTPVADLTPPRKIDTLTAKQSASSGGVDLTWTAPSVYHADGSGPYISSGYDLRYSTSAITDDTTFAAAIPVASLAAPKTPGSAEARTITGLTGGTKYYFAIKSANDAGIYSDVSNCALSKASNMGTKVLQVGLSGYTGEVDSYYGSAVSGKSAVSQLQVCGYADQGISNVLRGILRFNLTGQVPAGVTLTSATLSLYSYNPGNSPGSSGYYGLYPVTKAWTDSQATWLLAMSGANWTTAGGDFLATPDATAPKKAASSLPAWYNWDVTARVQSWINNASVNNGWIVKCTDENLHNQDMFYQCETGSIDLRPKLVISDITLEDITPPAAVTNLAAGSATASSINLTWTATGNDGTIGTATSYNLRYSTSPITDLASFNAATFVTGVPAPKAAGIAESFTVTGLSATTTYYFALVVSDVAGNASGLSNVVSLATRAPRKIGDINYDGYVNVGDLQSLVAAWGSDNSGAWGNWNPDADLNGDGYTNIGDLQILVIHWGQ